MLHRRCEACGTRREIEVHHIRPVHLFPELELDARNLLTLCATHHRELGHGGDCWAWVPSVAAILVECRTVGVVSAALTRRAARERIYVAA